MKGKYICFIILIILIILIGWATKKSDLYISKSSINNLGLFAGKDYKKGDVIIKNLFPNKTDNKILFNNIRTIDFEKFIIKEGKYINHCSMEYNSDVTTKDKKIYKVIAIKDIYKGEEITSNYDKIHMSYPFIGKSRGDFNVC